MILQGRRRDDEPLVSVVIPCFNQGTFLSDALASVASQTYPHVDVVLVNDGSTDNTSTIAHRHANVRYVAQDNQGLPAARNRGAREACGELLVFLDADDRLLPLALETGVRQLANHSDWVFVSGEHRYIDEAGRVQAEWNRAVLQQEHYRALLQGNYVGMIATVMFRRDAFDSACGFDETLRACEDYDLYLRLARTNAVGCHDVLVAEYRRHRGGLSNDPQRMLEAAVSVLEKQRPWAAGHHDVEEALENGLRYWARLYAPAVVAHADSAWRTTGDRVDMIAALKLLSRYAPSYIHDLERALLRPAARQ